MAGLARPMTSAGEKFKESARWLAESEAWNKVLDNIKSVMDIGLLFELPSSEAEAAVVVREVRAETSC